MSRHALYRQPGNAAAASLWGQAGWVMPAMVTVSVFSVLVSLSLVFATVQPRIARLVRGDSRDEPTSGPRSIELRSPGRATAAAAAGMLRP